MLNPKRRRCHGRNPWARCTTIYALMGTRRLNEKLFHQPCRAVDDSSEWFGHRSRPGSSGARSWDRRGPDLVTTVKWGFQDEFLDLFQRNHYPVLKARMEAGHYTSVRTYTPRYHGDRACRLDLRGQTVASAPGCHRVADKEEMVARSSIPRNSVKFRRKSGGASSCSKKRIGIHH